MRIGFIKKRFGKEMIFGIHALKDVKLYTIGRCQKEDI